MCISVTNIIGGLGEDDFSKQIKHQAIKYHSKHLIVPLMPCIEGLPFDRCVMIDKTIKSVQVKTTQKEENGIISFDTSHNGNKRYTENEIDFFFLYYQNEDTGEEWRGLALPSECTTTTKISLGTTFNNTIKQADDYDFDTRFNELIETGTIEPIDVFENTNKDVPYVEEEICANSPDLNDDNTFYSLFAYYDFVLPNMAKGLKISEKVLQQYHTAYISRTTENKSTT